MDDCMDMAISFVCYIVLTVSWAAILSEIYIVIWSYIKKYIFLNAFTYLGVSIIRNIYLW